MLVMCIQLSSPAQIKVLEVSKHGPPMIFIPHIGCPTSIWNDIAAYYKDRYHVFMIEMAGFGTSKPIQGDYSRSYIKAIQQFIREKGLYQATLVGQNYGAFIAVQASFDSSLRIGRLITSDFFPKLSMVIAPNMDSTQLTGITKEITKNTINRSDSAFAADQFQISTMMNFMDTAKAREFVQWQISSDRATLAGTLCEQLQTNLLPLMSDNKVPILAFTTWYFAKKYQNSPLTEAPKKLQQMFGNTPLITHAITEEAKDFIAVDQPQWFIERMNEFLKK